MAQLSARALVTFLQEMVVDGTTIREDKPVLLQIRSIIPVLREGNLWPNQGFFLRVSDLSHAIYVSLPQEDDDMVLYDKLHIGQYLFADKLEAAYPVPLLKGIKPLQGRRPCLGNPKDLIPLHVLEKFLGISKLDEEQKDVVKTPVLDHPDVDERRKCCSASGISSNEESSDGVGEVVLNRDENIGIGVVNEKSCEKPPLDTVLGRRRSLNSGDQDSIDKIMKKKPPSTGFSSRRSSIYRPRKGDDVESTLSYRSKRNDSESYYKGLRKCKPRYGRSNSDGKSSISTTSTVFKRKSWNGKEAMPRVIDITETPIVQLIENISLANSPRHDTSDDASSTITKKAVTSITTKSSKTPGENRTSEPEDRNSQEVSCCSINDQIGVGIDISWDLFPASLVKLGQEVLQKRDVAFVTAVEALLEASAAERLLKCLSLYSEVLSAKVAEEHHNSVDKFLSLEHDLSQTKKSIFQKPDKDQEPEDRQIAIERKKNAIEWIRTSLESNLTSVPNPNDRNELKNSTQEKITKKDTLTPRKAKTRIELQPEIGNRQDWMKGSEEMAHCLSNESNKWFLKYVEEYLDWVSRKSDSSQPDIQEPEMMFRIKKVSDWLDMICKDKSMEDSEIESCREVRSKIYGILLTHVERTARNALAEG